MASDPKALIAEARRLLGFYDNGTFEDARAVERCAPKVMGQLADALEAALRNYEALLDPPDPNCCRYCAARAALGGKK